jgi:hypothetical protein
VGDRRGRPTWCVGDAVVLGTPDQSDVSGVERPRLLISALQPRLPGRHGDKGERRLVLDRDRPGRVHLDPDHERLTRAGVRKQP